MAAVKDINFYKKNIQVEYFDYDNNFYKLDYLLSKISSYIKYGDKYGFLMKIKRSDRTFAMGGKHIMLNTTLFGDVDEAI